METLMCLHCGRLNESDAGDCRHCASPLPRGERHRHSTVDDYAPPPQEFVPPFESAGDVLRPTLRLYKENFGLVAKIVLAAAVPASLFEYALKFAGPQFWPYPLVFGTVADVLMMCALTYAAYTYAVTGINPTLAESYAAGVKSWPKAFVCYAATLLVVGVGLILFIAPGVYLSLLLALVVPLVVIEKTRIADVFSQSVALTKGFRLNIFNTYFISAFVLYGMNYLLTGSFLGALPEDMTGPLAVPVMLTLSLVESTVYVLPVFVYLGMQARRAQLAAAGPA
ncbi:MAG TPA: hypothetical protein VER08_06745 [Pyrinomonadaceae bacterium]|nr:hypothetical protein [Pyrinomonadaceae bacterium]